MKKILPAVILLVLFIVMPVFASETKDLADAMMKGFYKGMCSAGGAVLANKLVPNPDHPVDDPEEVRADLVCEYLKCGENCSSFAEWRKGDSQPPRLSN